MKIFHHPQNNGPYNKATASKFYKNLFKLNNTLQTRSNPLPPSYLPPTFSLHMNKNQVGKQSRAGNDFAGGCIVMGYWHADNTD